MVPENRLPDAKLAQLVVAARKKKLDDDKRLKNEPGAQGLELIHRGAIWLFPCGAPLKRALGLL